MTDARTLLDEVDDWNADARQSVDRLNAWRNRLLKEARALKMTAAVKALLVLPKIGGEPVAAEPPAAYPTGANSSVEQQRQFQEKLDPIIHQSGDLAVPKVLRR